MPTYDYKCEKCGHRFEAFQRMTDEPLKECPKCKGEVQRLITGGTGLIFKGSGFYITDYKNKETGNGKPTATKTESNKDSSAKAKDKPAESKKTSSSSSE